jgi:hypothetical protein
MQFLAGRMFTRSLGKLLCSLASLLILVAAVSLWLGRMSYLANRQREAVAAISAAEGIVIFDDDSNSSTKNVPNAALSSLERLQERIGKDYFRTARAVTFATNSGRRSGTREPKATDKNLAQLLGVTDVQELELSHNETVTDEALVHLAPDLCISPRCHICSI